MPSAIRRQSQSPTRTQGVTKFTNCRLVKGNRLIEEDLCVSSRTGKILDGQEIFYQQQTAPDEVVDLGGRILAPGFIDVQLNGAFGLNFSVEPDNLARYAKEYSRVRKSLVKTGVTSFLPTLTSQRSQVYHKVLPFLGPTSSRRISSEGSESLGAHCEGPFINTSRNGIHPPAVLQTPSKGITDIAACYGAENMERDTTPIKYVTLAPELPGALSAIADLRSRGIIVSIGHSAAFYEEAKEAVAAGATMITHLFNAMNPLHHRNPGMFGLLGQPSILDSPKPFFGIIADGIHLHASAINIAWNSHPDGFILVTDAMEFVGLPDGAYDWTDGNRIVKNGHILTLEGSDKLAGSCISLIECVNNFRNWSGAGIAQAIGAVTWTPARMLGVEGTKGSLEPGADADLVVLDDLEAQDGSRNLKIDQVWKFGDCVFDTSIE